MKAKYDMSGNFQGATLNIESKINSQEIRTMIGEISPNEISRKELQGLFNQLVEALKQVPPANAQEAEAVAESAKRLIDDAGQDPPNRPMVQVTAEGLKKAAENIANVVPSVLPVVEQIIRAVMRIVDK